MPYTALKAIKTLAQVALGTEDVGVLHRHLQLIINVIEKVDAEEKRVRDAGANRKGTPPFSIIET